MGRFVNAVQAEFGADGVATVIIGVPSGCSWSITSAAVSTTSTARTTAMLYIGSPSPAALVDSTYSGNLATSNAGYQALQGEVVTCVWTGGDPGARATLRLSGTQDQG